MFNLHTHKVRPNEQAIESIELNHFDSERASNPFSVGAHPWTIEAYDLNYLQEQVRQAAQHKQCCAIGEIGLDRVCTTPLSQQKEAFRLQVEVAQHLNLPVIIHSVKTHADLLQFKPKESTPWILHGFLGNHIQFDQLLKAGCYFSFGWRSLRHKKTIETFKQAPLESIFLETDEEDILIHSVYERAAELRNITIEELEQNIKQNCKTIFF